MGRKTVAWIVLLCVVFGCLFAAEQRWASAPADARKGVKRVAVGEFLKAVEAGRFREGWVGYHVLPAGLADLLAAEDTGAGAPSYWQTTARLTEGDLLLLRARQFHEGDGESLAQVPLPKSRADYGVMAVHFGRLASGWLLILTAVVLTLRYMAVQTGVMMPKKFEAVHSNVRFASVAGCDEAKEEVAEVVDFLRNPKRYVAAGGRMPRGVLLVGPPGTGKTMLAKAVAGEAAAHFYSLSGSDFVEMYVGVGASRIRSLFKKARENAPSIIFIDELDAVGRQRSATSSSGGQQEHEHTLNALLVEMDGFASDAAVVVFAATNRPEIIDKALLRPGRFDRQVSVELPDKLGREQILKVHTAKVKLAEEVALDAVASATAGFSGADLANLVNEGALHAARHGRAVIVRTDLEEARDKLAWGRERRRSMTEDERRLIAVHEAGHALMQLLSADTSVRLHKITILPRGQSLGSTQFTPERDILNYTKEQIVARIGCLMGGRVAEEQVLGRITNGASADIQEASKLARKMVLQWGMSDYGFLALVDAEGGSLGSSQTLHEAEQRVKSLLDDCYRATAEALRKHRSSLDGIVAALLEQETISGDEARSIHNRHLAGKDLGICT